MLPKVTVETPRISRCFLNARPFSCARWQFHCREQGRCLPKLGTRARSTAEGDLAVERQRFCSYADNAPLIMSNTERAPAVTQVARPFGGEVPTIFVGPMSGKCPLPRGPLHSLARCHGLRPLFTRSRRRKLNRHPASQRRRFSKRVAVRVSRVSAIAHVSVSGRHWLEMWWPRPSHPFISPFDESE